MLIKSAKYSKGSKSFDEASITSEKISKQSSIYEGGDGEDDEDNNQEEYLEDEIDPDDPYQINRLNDIDHDVLKEMYTQVVDELLDLQLEFEEKLAEAEE